MDISGYWDLEDGTINLFEKMHVECPGLHYIIPKQGEKNNLVSLDGSSASSEGMKAVLTSAAAVTEGTLDVDLGTANAAGAEVVISSEVFDNLKNNAADLINTSVAVTLGAEESTEAVKAAAGNQVEYAVTFDHSGVLPGTAKVTLPVSVADGAYTWYYVEPGTNALKEGQDVTVSGGMVTVRMTHCSSYALVKKTESGSQETDTGSSGTGSSDGTQSSESSSSASAGIALTSVPKTADAFPVELLALVCLAVFLIWRRTGNEKTARS